MQDFKVEISEIQPALQASLVHLWLQDQDGSMLSFSSVISSQQVTLYSMDLINLGLP